MKKSGLEIDLSGETALVTGGANGIGLATARVLVEAGAAVWILDLETEKPEEAAASIGARGLAADVTNRESMERAFAAVPEVSIVVSCAGVARQEDLTATTAELWERTIAVNLTGAFHTVQLAAAAMKKRGGGSIVLTASTNSFDGEAKLVAYNASKAGILGILHTSANELGPYGIRVNAVCPGLIRTRLTQDYFDSPEPLEEYFRHIPMGRGGEPEEVARAVAFLASGLASFITGATLLVDGGQMASKFSVWNEGMGAYEHPRWVRREKE